MRPLWLPAVMAVVLAVPSCLGQPSTPQEVPPKSDTVLPLHLIEVQPAPGATVRLDSFVVYATFDISDTGMGADWRGPVRLGIGGTQLEGVMKTVEYRDAPTKGSVYFPSLRKLLEDGSLATIPPVKEGPVDLVLRYQDRSGGEYRYAWQVRLQLRAPQAPPEVHRIRKVHALMEEVGNRVPGFGDYLLDLEGDLLNVYLAEAADPQEVERAIAQVFGPDLPSGGLKILQPDVDARLIYRWQQQAFNAVWPLGGVLSSGFFTRRNRYVFDVTTPYFVHKARAALSKTTVPQEAVVFYVRRKKALYDPPPQAMSPIGVGISLDFKPQVRMGQALLIEVVLKNQRDVAVQFDHEIPFNEDVLVFTPDGDQVWKKPLGFLAPVGGSTSTLLGPGEEVRLKTYWDLTDLDDFALPPGRYLVRATVRISDVVDGYYRPMDLATSPSELIIRR